MQKYIFFLSVEQREIKRTTRLPQKKKKKKGFELSKREQGARSKTSRHFYKNHLVGLPVLTHKLAHTHIAKKDKQSNRNHNDIYGKFFYCHQYVLVRNEKIT